LSEQAVSRQFAGRLALIAFATTSVRGLISGDDFQGTLQGALLVLAAFYGVGWLVGDLARRVVEELAHAEFARLLADQPGPGS
jgi:hypothetical protein